MLSADCELVLGHMKMDKNRLASECLQSGTESKMTAPLVLYPMNSQEEQGCCKRALQSYRGEEGSGWMGGL